MKLKFKNILLISLLAVAGIFSATAVAFNKQVNETPVAEKAEAHGSNYTTSEYLYVDTSAFTDWEQAGDDSIRAYCIHNWDYKKGGGWGATGEKLYDHVYKCYFPNYGTNGTGAGVARLYNNAVADYRLWSVADVESGSYVQITGWTDDGSIGATGTITINEVCNNSIVGTKTFPCASGGSKSSSLFVSHLSSHYGYTATDNFWTGQSTGTKETTLSAGSTYYCRYTAASTKDYYLDATDAVSSDFFDKPDNVWVHAWDASGAQDYGFSNIQRIVQIGSKATARAYKVSLPSNVSFVWAVGSAKGTHDYVAQTEVLSNVSGTNLYVLENSQSGKVWAGSWESGKVINGSTALVTLKYTYGSTKVTIGTYGKLIGTEFILANGLVPVPATYSINPKWYDESNPSTKYDNLSGFYPTGNITLVNACQYIEYSIQFDYVVDGVLQDKTIIKEGNNYNWTSLAKGTAYTTAGNQKFSDLADPIFYGCSFDGWYSDAACTTGLASTSITGNYSSGVYAKFTSNNTNHNYYLGIVGSEENVVNINADLIAGKRAAWSPSSAAYTYVWYWNEGHTVSTVVKLRETLGISLDGWKFFTLRLPTTAESFLFCSGSWEDNNKYNQTINLDTGSGDTTIHASGKTLYAITSTSSSGSLGERKGRWVDSAYVLEVADNATFNSNLQSYPMMVPTEIVVETETNKTNVAQIMKITISANKYVRGRYYFTVGDKLYESTAVTRGGDDGVAAYTQQTQLNSQNVGVKMLSEKTVNIYINSQRKLFFVDCSGVEAAGFIYISTQYTPSQINVTCTVTTTDSGTLHPFNGEKLSSVTGHTYSTTLTYDGLKGMIMVPIYNLKKSAPKSTDTFAISLASASGSVNLTGVSILAEGTAEYLVVLDSGSTWSGDVAVSSSSDVAIVAYDIDRAIAAMQDKSVCSIDSTTAKRLCDEYDEIIKAGGAAKTTLEACTVSTWASTVGDSGDDILLPKIRYQLGNIVGGEYRTSPLGSFINIFNLMGSESGLSTVIIVIASSVALLSVTALSILVIRKRKSKEIE